MAEPALGELVHAAAALAGVEHVGEQHGVVIGRHMDAAAGEDQPVVFQVLRDLEDRRVFEQRLQAFERLRLLDLAVDAAAAEEIAFARLVGQRHIGGLARRGGKADADQLRLHGIERGGLGVDGETAERLRFGDPGVEVLQRGDRRIGLDVDGHGHRGSDPGGNGCSQCCAFAPLSLAFAKGLAAQGGRRGARSRRFCPLTPRSGRGQALSLSHKGRGDDAGRCCGCPSFRPFGRPVEDRDGGRFDRLDEGIERLGDAAGERREFHRLAEGDEPRPVAVAHGEIGKRDGDRHMVVERHQLLGKQRLLGVGLQRFAPLGLLDGIGVGEQGFDIAIFADELRRGLHPDTGHARHVVDRIAGQRLHLDDLFRRHAEPLLDLGLADAPVLHGIEHDHARADELHQVLVGGDDGDVGAGFRRLPCIGGDEIVRLEAELLDGGQVEGFGRVADEAELGPQILRRLRPVGLVRAIELVAEGALGLVEDDAEIGRTHAQAGVRQELPQHVAEAGDGADRQAVRLAGERRQGVIGAEDEGRAVDQEDMVAGAETGAGWGGFPGGLRRCVGCRFRHGATMPRGRADGYGGGSIADTAKGAGASPRCQRSHMVM